MYPVLIVGRSDHPRVREISEPPQQNFVGSDINWVRHVDDEDQVEALRTEGWKNKNGE